jgi:hypothetical protein
MHMHMYNMHMYIMHMHICACACACTCNMHMLHVCDLGRVEAQQLVERRSVMAEASQSAMGPNVAVYVAAQSG